MDITLAKKYRGCLLGALLGDCLGAPFDELKMVSNVLLQQYFDTLSGPFCQAPVKKHKGDTAMTKCLVNNILSNRGLEPRDLAKRFTNEYFNDPTRGYGSSVHIVLHKLRSEKFEDPFGPAKDQFQGAGSFGNGGALRIAPITLWYNKNLSDVIEKAKLATKITHTHELGVNGAILQVVAVYQSLQANPEEKLNTQSFTDGLLNVMSSVEKSDRR